MQTVIRRLSLVIGIALILLPAACGKKPAPAAGKTTAVPAPASAAVPAPENAKPTPPPAQAGSALGTAPFVDVWQHVSATSVVLAWSCGDREQGARSLVEYGADTQYGSATAETDTLRLNQFHRLTGLSAGTEYHARLVSIGPDGNRTVSEDIVLKPAMPEGAVPLSANEGGAPIKITSPGTYVLSGDINAPGAGIVIVADDVTLDLDGHVLTYATGTTTRVHGILVNDRDKTNRNVKLVNGIVIQQPPSAEYTDKYGSFAVGSFSNPEQVEIAGMTLSVQQKNAYPIALVHSPKNYNVHHNYAVSTVATLFSRHWPANAMLQASAGTGDNRIHNNILLNGPHRGIECLGGDKEPVTVSVYSNDVSTDQGYVNGYAIHTCHNMKVYNNRIKSCSRGIHITTTNVEVYDNYFDLTQHMVYDDRPQGGTTWLHYYTVIHGIKFEDCGEGVKVHGNKVIGTQLLPEPDAPQRFSTAVQGEIKEYDASLKGDRDHWAPPTPLNIAPDKNAMVEVYDNEFIGITNYKTARYREDYGLFGEWACGICIVGDPGPSDESKYAVWIHDNIFRSNDSWISAPQKCSYTLKLENNQFYLLDNPIEGHTPLRGDPRIGELMKGGGNTFEGMQP